MAVEVQYRYGTTAEHSTFTGVSAEMTVDTTKHVVVVHDGVTTGGFPMARENLSNVPTLVGATPTVAGTTGKLPVPQAGDQDKVLYGDGSWKSLPTPATLQVITESTTARTLGLTDAENYIRFNNAAAKTLTVPTNATVAFPIGTTISGNSATAGQLTIVAASGVTINTPETLKLRARAFTSFVLTKIGTDVWDLAGDLELSV